MARQEVAMQLRDALIQQGPSLELQRAAQDEISRLDNRVALLRKALMDTFDVLSMDQRYCTGRVARQAERILDETDPLLAEPARPFR